MAADETYGTGGPADWASDRPKENADSGPLQADHVAIERSAVGSVTARQADIAGSAVGSLSAEGQVTVSMSATGIVNGQADVSLDKGYATVMVAGGDLSVRQGGGSVLAGNTVSVDTGGAALMVAGEADVRKGWIGILLTRDANLSEDSRVIVDTKAAIIISAVLAAGFAMVAAIMADAFGRVFEQIRHRLHKG